MCVHFQVFVYTCSSPTGFQAHDEIILLNREAAVDQLDIAKDIVSFCCNP